MFVSGQKCYGKYMKPEDPQFLCPIPLISILTVSRVTLTVSVNIICLYLNGSVSAMNMIDTTGSLIQSRVHFISSSRLQVWIGPKVSDITSRCCIRQWPTNYATS
jgi:hypothetical protein